MKSNNWLFCFLLIAGNILAPLISKSQGISKKNNVIFITTHDMNEHVDFLGTLGPNTPNFDRLAAHGMVFYNHYTQYPYSNPGKTCLLSGWRPDKTQVFSNGTEPRSVMGDTVKFLPEYFDAFGYRTERYGTIMLNDWESDIKWDYVDTTSFAGINKTKDPLHLESQTYRGGDWWINNDPDTLKKGSDYTKHLVERLKQPEPDPFFYGLGFVTTHNPFQPNLANWDKNGDPVVRERLPDKKGDTTYFIGNGSGNIKLPQTPPGDRNDVPPIAFHEDQIIKSDDEWRKTIHAYEGDLSQLDTFLGWALDEIDRQNLWENTVVIFWVDHGQHLGEHEGTWLKGTIFEESLRIPLIICAPGKKPGICYNLTENVDVYSTLAELCGLPLPPGMQGTSLVPLLDDPSLPWKRAAFSQILRTKQDIMGRSIRTQQYRYNSWETDGEELYDHFIDPFEYTNLAGNTAYSTVLDEMRTILAEGWEKSLPPVYSLLSFYRDHDNDGFGSTIDSIHAYAVLPGYVANSGDCNDDNAAVNPGMTEICDGIDNNCNGIIDEGVVNVSVTPTSEVSICKNKTVTLKAASTPKASFQWLRNSVLMPGETKANYTADSAGNYQVIATVNNLCSDTSAVTAVTVVNTPTAKITAKGNLDICSTGAVLLRANKGTDFTYQWKINNTDIAGANARDYTAAKEGSYKVQVTNFTGCKNNSTSVTVIKSCFTASTKSTEEAVDNNNAGILTVAPNPNSGIVKVNFISQEVGQVYLKVYSAEGKELINIKEYCVKGLNGYQLNLSKLSSGTYFVELGSKKTVARKMMIIQK